MNDPHRQPFVALILSAVTMMVATGCADPRFDQASQKRLDRIDQRFQEIQDREAQNPTRLAKSRNWMIRSLDRHRDRFQKDLAYVDATAQREIDRWPARRKRQKDFLQDYLDGDIERADRTIPRLLY